MNPFDLRGPDFLKLYVVVAAAILFLAIVLRRKWMRVYDNSDEPQQLELDAYETAYLAGGPEHCLNAAIANLVQQDVLSFDKPSKTFYIEKPLVEADHPMEEQLLARMDPAYGTKLWKTRFKKLPAMQAVRSRLAELGLIYSPGHAALIRLLPLSLMVAVTGFGVIKIAVGIGRARPVGFLVLLVFAAAISTCFFMTRVLRTKAGDLALDCLRKRHAALETTSRAAADRLSGADLAMAVGLFGVGVLLGSELELLRGGFLTPLGGLDPRDDRSSWFFAGSSGGHGGGGCGGGDGGGCGDGGGGCGGGGCGGCGGGD